MDLRKQAAVEFVENLEIEVLGSGRLWRPSEGTAFGDVERQKRSAFVVAASVVAFSDGVFGQQKEDLLNSTLLAQLAANRKYDRERDTHNWYLLYRSVLEQVGWSIEKQPSIGVPPATERSIPSRQTVPGLPGLPRGSLQLRFTRVIVDQPRFTASVQVLKLLSKHVEEDAFDTAQTALEVLSGLDDHDRRVVIFETSSHSAVRGNFQIVAANVGPDEMLHMTIAAVFFVASERVSRVLTFNFASSNTQMTQVRDTMTLSSADYNKVRDQVIQQLGDQAAVYIDELNIG